MGNWSAKEQPMKDTSSGGGTVEQTPSSSKPSVEEQTPATNQQEPLSQAFNASQPSNQGPLYPRTNCGCKRAWTEVEEESLISSDDKAPPCKQSRHLEDCLDRPADDVKDCQTGNKKECQHWHRKEAAEAPAPVDVQGKEWSPCSGMCGPCPVEPSLVQLTSDEIRQKRVARLSAVGALSATLDLDIEQTRSSDKKTDSDPKSKETMEEKREAWLNRLSATQDRLPSRATDSADTAPPHSPHQKAHRPAQKGRFVTRQRTIFTSTAKTSNSPSGEEAQGHSCDVDHDAQSSVSETANTDRDTTHRPPQLTPPKMKKLKLDCAEQAEHKLESNTVSVLETEDSEAGPALPAEGKVAEDKVAEGKVAEDKVAEGKVAGRTADGEKLRRFVEKAFDCSLTVVEDAPSMRFSGGRMRLPAGDFPSDQQDVEGKMSKLARQAFHKQVNKVKFSVHAYNVCESEGEGFHDTLVDKASTVIRTEAVTCILSHFQQEKESQKWDDSLWDSYEGETELNVFEYETYGFLPRLIQCASDGANVSPALLSCLLAQPQAPCFLTSLLHSAGHRFTAASRLDEMLLSEGSTLQALDCLVQNPQFGEALAAVMARETQSALEHSLGSYFQRQCALSSLLGVSTIPEKCGQPGPNSFLPSPAAQKPFTSLRSYPRLTHDDVNTAQAMIQKGVQRLQEVVYCALKRVMSGKGTREAGLAWLAALISLNQLRTSAITQEEEGGIQPVCSDGLMVNVCSVLLELYLPISRDVDKLHRVDLSYSASPACRFHHHFLPCLAAGQIVKEEGAERGGQQAAHSFITECFHLTQRALGVSLVPAIKHYNAMMRHYSGMMEQVQGTDREESVKNQHMLAMVAWETCLMEPELVRGVTAFYVSQAQLLLSLINNAQQAASSEEAAHQAQRKALSQVPEFCVKDMAQWFSFLALSVLPAHPHAAKNISLTPFVDCCVTLLERPDLMPGPVAASMTVSALLAFMADRSQQHRDSGWGSGIMSDLAAMVHTCPSVQTQLGPALLRTYVSVDVVEGLDVDQDSFDKFSARVQMGQLVEKLWSRSDCRASIISQCGSDLFQNFLNAILDTLLYMLHDSLSRLANVKKIETLKANEEEWRALPRSQQAEKEMFLRSEESVGSGFMRQAKKTLRFLTLLSQADTVVQCFTRQPLASRAASTINGFLDALCGSKAKDLKVKDMSKYQFNPVELLVDIMNITLRIVLEDRSPTEGFLVSMVTDADFELSHLEKAASVVVSKGCGEEETRQRLEQLVQQVRQLAAQHNPQASCPLDEDGSWRQAFLDTEVDERQLEEQYTNIMADLRFGDARILPGPYCFTSNASGAENTRSDKVRVLMKEIRQLSTSLPVHPGASIFVKQDRDRCDVMRALITGPTGTPYSLGCFCFDVYFPSTYPNVPPLVKIITTGQGTVRFNPNLYADGKVCLSLLGTWHAGDASEKWSPSQSSLYQVLVSIQSMILTSDPVFNEPGYHRIKGTQEGEVQSGQYNWKLQLQTLRHAVLGQLNNPPAGFERVVRRHFALQREAVLKQCAVWVKGCQDPDLLKRMCRTADAIFEQLMDLEVDLEGEEEGDSEEEEEEGV